MTPDYTALETEAREQAKQFGEHADAARAAYLEGPSQAAPEDYSSGIYEQAEQWERMADALSHAASLQAEIERLKGYVRHRDDCELVAEEGPLEGGRWYRVRDRIVEHDDETHAETWRPAYCTCGLKALLAPETGAT